MKFTKGGMSQRGMLPDLNSRVTYEPRSKSELKLQNGILTERIQSKKPVWRPAGSTTNLANY